jgi:hypothetical protein
LIICLREALNPLVRESAATWRGGDLSLEAALVAASHPSAEPGADTIVE